MNQITVVINFKDNSNCRKEIIASYKHENIYGLNSVFTFTHLDNIFNSDKIIIYYIMDLFSLGKFNHITINEIPKFEDGSIIEFSHTMYSYLKSNDDNKKIFITI